VWDIELLLKGPFSLLDRFMGAAPRQGEVGVDRELHLKLSKAVVRLRFINSWWVTGGNGYADGFGIGSRGMEAIFGGGRTSLIATGADIGGAKRKGAPVGPAFGRRRRL